MGPASASSGVNDQQKDRKPQSLLVQALAVPSLNGSKPPPQQTVRPAPVRHQSSSDSLHGLPEPFIPVHSDFTIPTSNLSFSDYEEDVPDQLSSTKRRSVFGQGVSHKYRITRVESSDTLPVDHRSIEEPPMVASTVPRHYNDRTISDLTPPSSPSVVIRNVISPLTPYCENPTSSSSSSTNKRRIKAHETIHAQSLLLGFAFMAIWSPQNGMAPNLTEIAEEFGFNSAERDFYLGSILSLAAGVLSFPMSAGIGIMTDMYSRKHLFVLTVAMGGLSSWATGASRTYRCLFWARLLNGGCMSGSVPIAFSLLSDLFQSSERNAASSGLSAMMGVGIVAGQVYAGVVGSTLGWPHIFYVSAIWTLASAFLVWLFVQEPVRGGKEKVLQDMLESGTHYDRKLSWKGFLHAIWYNKSNSILMWQGFFSSVPWGIIFVFLNDYLSQERGFSVPDATYLVFMFGLGCAAGGVLGGYWGQLFIDWNRSYLPLFMAATTFLGIFPFIGLLNGSFTNAHGVEAVFFSIMGGLIASLPSVNVRPCIINVNPPETRGAALTAANLIINLARGAGPSCITLMGAIWHVNRKFSFNVTVRSTCLMSWFTLSCPVSHYDHSSYVCYT